MSDEDESYVPSMTSFKCGCYYAGKNEWNHCEKHQTMLAKLLKGTEVD